ncbi:terminase small subunit [Lactobacillus hamsteri]|uniref:Phage terminase, small subunit n=1 Tax=Lactobacillus hamsteri DSM 5661 = JCM 6256 TaxID=1423754 RepID=A0A0R1Y5Q2_9LACO|nr:Phage terminase, small subunit [Lactobacillus hamsteri DSM 5661 = JCM 6256]
MKLTAKQKLFCDEYIKSGNATEAATKAGYSNKTARFTGAENLTKPNIKSYITDKMKEIESHKIADAKEVLEFYTRIIRDEVEEEVVVSTAEEAFKISKKPSLKDKVNAGKELLKRYPSVDPIEKVKLRKLLADTRVSEAKAKAMEDNGQDIELLLDKMMDKLAKEDLKHGSN